MPDHRPPTARRAGALIAGFVAVVTALAWVVATFLGAPAWVGVVVGLVLGVALVALAVRWAPALALRTSRARPADPNEHKRLFNLVEGLCIAGGLLVPQLYVIDDPAPNALVVGRSTRTAAIAATTGLLATLDRIELEGVLAHELSHVRDDDILVATLAVPLVGGLALVGDLALRSMWWNGGRTRREGDPADRTNPLGYVGIGLLGTSTVLGPVMRAVVGRRRDPLADLSAVSLTRYPPGLIAALDALRTTSTVASAASRATAHLWIASPLARTPAEGRLSRINRMYDTHPPLDERIAALREL